jgi:hypothetical protein
MWNRASREAEGAMSDEEVFPRPCKNCGNQAMMYKGKLVHVYRKREKCRVFREWAFERDKKGQVTAMHWMGDFPIPDPPTAAGKAQAELGRLAEWNRLYSSGAEPSRKEQE